jgi:hypothetical protein
VKRREFITLLGAAAACATEIACHRGIRSVAEWRSGIDRERVSGSS